MASKDSKKKKNKGNGTPSEGETASRTGDAPASGARPGEQSAATGARAPATAREANATSPGSAGPAPSSKAAAAENAAPATGAGSTAGSPSLTHPPGDGAFMPASGQAANAPVQRGLNIVLLVALLGGLGVATYLTRAHLELVYGDSSFKAVCDFGGGFSCTDVITSQYATLFGVLPWSVLALPVYSVLFMLALRGVTLNDRKSLGLVALLGTFATALSAALFYVSSFLIGAWCPFCIVMYAVNLAAMLLPRFIMGETFSDSLRYGFRSLSDRRTIALSAANLLFVGALAWGGFSAAKTALIEQTRTAVMGTPRPQTPGKTDTGPSANRSADARRDVPIDASVPFHGATTAKVTIVAYEDFQCGFCKRLAGNFMQLLDKYPNDVRIGFRHFPMNQSCNAAGIPKTMHPDACRAALASECANQQGKFWEMHDLLFKNSRDLSNDAINQYAQEAGLDTAALARCVQDPNTLAKVQEDSRTGKALGVGGTPTFFINGKQFAGAQSLEVLSAVVDAELAGQDITMAELRDVKPLPDLTGPVQGPEMTTLTGPDGPFEIDTFEARIENGKAVSKAGQEATTNVTWFDADKACKAAGKRLCTEGEWLSACSGALAVDENRNGDYSDDPLKGSTYPYGEYYKAGVCNDQVLPPKDASAANPPPPPPLITGNHPECKSKFNVYDLTGNVREWVGFVAPRSAYFGGAFYSRDDAACISRAESFGPFAKQEALGFRCCRGGNPKDRVTHPGRQVGETLAPFSGMGADGNRLDSSMLKGHVSLLTFWASWCGPCREELPAYASIYPELEKKGFRILSVNVDQDPAKARQFMEKTPLNFPVLLDSDNNILQSFDTKAMPTAFLLNEKGQILLRRTGFEKGDEKRLVKTVEKMLAEQGKN